VSHSRRLLLGLAAVALLGLGLWSLPRWLDWNAQRPHLAAIAAERLGRPVTLEGPVAFVLLPQPRLEAFRVRVADTGDGVRAEARALRLRLALAPLLFGRIVVREVALVGADIQLPWPPVALPGLLPPAWLSALDARIEDGRVQIGDVAIEGVQARLTAGDPADAVRAAGEFRWGNRPVTFEGALGRAGDDGIAPLDLAFRLAGGRAQLRGVLFAEGGFEGRFDAEGPDLAALIPAPAGAFRARGTLRAGTELVAADALVLEGAAIAARGAASLRLIPAPRFDLSLTAPRLDLASWIAALRGAGPQAIPLALDLAAEAAEFGPLRLRRLRGAAYLEGERLGFSDVAADLPGGTQMELSGGSSGPRLDLALRLRSARPREFAASLGLAAALPIPTEAAEGSARLSLEGSSLAATDLALRFGSRRVTGGLTWRQASRPSLALGLDFDQLDLGEGQEALARLREAAEQADLTLRLAIARLSLDGAEWRRVALDGSVEAGRAVLRSLAAERDGAEFQAAGALALGAQPRLTDAVVEARGAAGAVLGLAGVVPHPSLALVPLRLRAQGQGPLDQLALRLEAEAAEARLEAQGTVDTAQRRAQGHVTLRHPGAVRLLGQLGLAEPRLGEGSLSLIATLATQPGQLQAENIELVAGGLRLRGQGGLAFDGARPRLRARIAVEELPLPVFDDAILPALGGLDAELALTAQTTRIEGWPPLEQAQATLRLQDGALRIEQFQGRLSGGTVEGALAYEPGRLPLLAAEGRIADVAVVGPLSGLPIDLTAGRVTGMARLRAEGHSLAALLATLSGEAAGEVRGGVLTGFDLPAAASALALREPAAVTDALRRAFASGATAFEVLSARLAIEAGQARFEEAALSAEGSLPGHIGGQVDLARQALDLRLGLRPPEGPEVALRLAGPAANPRRQEEVGAYLRWLAEQPPPASAERVP
jgi:uncharacterized protein involved in outer membrane biogenesis